MKTTKCMYCDDQIKYNFGRPTKCERCFKLWSNFRTKYREYGVGISAHTLVFWYLNTPQVCVECGTNQNITTDRIIPGSQGGLYELNNIQKLCYTCNCCKKWKFKSVEEALEADLERACVSCGQVKLLNDQLWYRKGFIPKYKILGKSLFHNKCKECVLKERRGFYNLNQPRIRRRRKELRNES